MIPSLTSEKWYMKTTTGYSTSEVEELEAEEASIVEEDSALKDVEIEEDESPELDEESEVGSNDDFSDGSFGQDARSDEDI
ncbi:hypothetical protein HK098_004094 [Nowakowskiella sp. JEL0407]|nr:hypothetical protein HK098_004094 [Nowakowskiella sp. JEL0407]